MLWAVLSLIGALFSSLRHVASKKFSTGKGESLDFVFLNYLFSFLLMLPFIKYLDAVESLKIWIYLFLFAILSSGGVFFIFYVYQKTEISSTAPLLNLSPIILLITSFFFLGETLNIAQLVGVVFIMLGGYLISLKSINNFFHPFTRVKPKYLALIFLTLTFWSIAAPIFKIVLLKISIYSVLFYAAAFCTIFWAIILYFTKNLKKVFSLPKNKYLLPLAGSIFYLLSDVAIAAAFMLPGVLVSVVITLKRTSTLFSVIIGGNHFKEKDIAFKTVSCIIMILGATIISFA